MGGSIHIFREFLNPSSHCPALSNGAVFELVMKTLTQLCVPASFGTLENISVLTWLCIDYIQNKNKVTKTLKYSKKVALIQVCIYTHRHLYKMYIYETHEMWNSVHIVLHKILFWGKKKKRVPLLKIPVETSGLGFPRPSSTLHLRVHRASPK